MRALHDVDRVDLDVAETLDGGPHGRSAAPERRRAEALRVQPAGAGVGAAQRMRDRVAGHRLRLIDRARRRKRVAGGAR